MRVTNHGGAIALLASAVLIIAGCSDSAEAPSGLATSDPATAGPSPSPPDESEPTPTPTSTVPPALEALRSMELPQGLVIDDIPDATGMELAALDTFVRFEIARWQSLLDSEVRSELGDLASDEVVQDVRDQVEVQVDEGFHLGGTLTMESPQVDAAESGIAVVRACFNQGEVTVVRDGNEEVGEDAAANPVYQITADVSNAGGGWVITDYRGELDAC